MRLQPALPHKIKPNNTFTAIIPKKAEITKTSPALQRSSSLAVSFQKNPIEPWMPQDITNEDATALKAYLDRFEEDYTSNARRHYMVSVARILDTFKTPSFLEDDKPSIDIFDQVEQDLAVDRLTKTHPHNPTLHRISLYNLFNKTERELFPLFHELNDLKLQKTTLCTEQSMVFCNTERKKHGKELNQKKSDLFEKAIFAPTDDQAKKYLAEFNTLEQNSTKKLHEEILQYNSYVDTPKGAEESLQSHFRSALIADDKRFPDRWDDYKGLIDLFKDIFSGKKESKSMQLNQKIEDTTQQILKKRYQQLLLEGFKSPVDYYSTLKEYDIARLNETVNKFAKTDGKKLFWDCAGQYIQEMRHLDDPVKPENISSQQLSDIMSHHLNIGRELFQQDSVKSLLNNFFTLLGLDDNELVDFVEFKNTDEYQTFLNDPDRKSTIHIDMGERSGKSGRAVCIPTASPDEIYVSIGYHHGLDTNKTILHELGHALHHAFTDESLPLPLKSMGNYAVTETYAFLFEDLMTNKDFLQKNFDISPQQAEKIEKSAKISRLNQILSKMCSLDYEIELNDGYPYSQEKIDKYIKANQEVFNYTPIVGNWYDSLDPGFYAADYVTAYILKEQLEAHLVDTYGDNWYEQKPAIDFLKDCWKEGNISPQTLAAKINSPDPFDCKALVNNYQKVFSSVVA